MSNMAALLLLIHVNKKLGLHMQVGFNEVLKAASVQNGK